MKRTGIVMALVIFFGAGTWLTISCGGGGGGDEEPPVPIPAIPLAVTATPESSAVTISWTSVEGATSYNLYMASVPGVSQSNFSTLADGATLAAVASPCKVSNLTNGVTWYFVVTAVNSSGESPESSEVAATPQPVPSQPTGVTGKTESEAVTISWNQVSGATSYNLYRAEEPGITRDNYASLAGGVLISGATSPYYDSGLSSNVSYYYVVTGKNDIYEGEESLQLPVMSVSLGWYWQDPSPTASGLNELSFADSTRGWSVGDGGTIIRTTDGGQTWTGQNSGTLASLLDVDFADSRHGWAVGEGGTVLHTSDGGQTWVALATGETTSLWAVSFIDPQTGWVANYNGTILHTEDGGASWTSQSVGMENGRLLKISFIDSLIGFALGIDDSNNNYLVFRTDDGGGTWNPSQPFFYPISDFAFASSTEGWTVGIHWSGSSYEYKINATNTGGTTWGTQYSGLEQVTNIDFADSDNGWAVGPYGTVLHTSNGGGTWSVQSSGTGSHLTAVEAVTPNLAWAVGDQGVVLHTVDGGDTWTSQHSSVWAIPSGATGVSFIDSTTGWVSGKKILHTTDSGATWVEQSSPAAGWLLWDIDFVDSNHGWAVGNVDFVLSTSNGGSSWTTQNLGGVTQLRAVDFINTTTGWAVGPSGRILRTTDGGTTWEDGSGNASNTVHYMDVAAVDENTVWVAGEDGIILKTTNASVSSPTWLSQISGILQDLSAITAVSSMKAWAVGYNSAPIIATTNGGSTWIYQYTDVSASLWGIAFADTVNGWAVGDYGQIYGTKDGGDTWTPQGSNMTETIYGVDCGDLNHVWAVGFGILKTDTGGY